MVLIFECEDCHYAKKGYTFLIEGVIQQLARCGVSNNPLKLVLLYLPNISHEYSRELFHSNFVLFLCLYADNS